MGVLFLACLEGRLKSKISKTTNNAYQYDLQQFPSFKVECQYFGFRNVLVYYYY